MICCALGIAAVATGAVGWRGFWSRLHWRLTLQTALTAFVALMVIIAAASLGLEHLRRHAAYAGERISVADLDASPLCRSWSRDRAGPITIAME
jgi:hypothetical protein